MGMFTNGSPKEPKLAPLPPAQRSAIAEAWFGEHEKLERENAYLNDEATRLGNGLKVANEHIAMLKEELAHVRNQLDYVTKHDHDILNSLDNIETLIVAAKKKARAHAYAAPGTGVDPAAERTAEAQEKIDQAAAELGKMLAPEPVNA